MSIASFEVEPKVTKLIELVVERIKLCPTLFDSIKQVHGSHWKMYTIMDLTACHANGCPMDWKKLLKADDFNFIHDVAGIVRNIDRETGELQNFFAPRCES